LTELVRGPAAAVPPALGHRCRSGATFAPLSRPHVTTPSVAAAISKHLKVVESTGVVKRGVEGRTHRLSLEPVR
jgi:hypothetical protein